VEYRRLGASGVRVSEIGLGSWLTYGVGVEADQAKACVAAAYDLGVNFFDTADVYGRGAAEEVLGQALAGFPRSSYVLATKVYFPVGDGPNDRGLSRKHVLASIDASLRRLGTDHVDLYQIHRFDPDTPIEETMEVLHDIVRAGKARYIGASSMYAWQFAKAQHTADLGGWTRFVSMQDHYNLIYREEEREMHPLCLDQGVGVIPWSPLARGRLARLPEERTTTRAGADPIADSMYTESDDAVVQAVADVAKARGLPLAQVALAWMLHKEAVTAPIVGATKPGHIEDAVAAVDVELSEEEIASLEAPYVPHPVLGH
jgi:1-deoxyxylulose-5-phosphate synthase